jgi:hypothetical protein
MRFTKILTIIALISVCLFLISCNKTSDDSLTGGITGEDNETNTIDDVNNEDCALLEGSAKDDCYSQNLQCSMIESDSVRDSCVVELAAVANQIEACDLVMDEDTQAYCLYRISEVNNDVEVCESIGDEYWQDNCYNLYSTSNSNRDYCSYITRTDQQQECFKTVALESQDIELCTYLSYVEANRCILTITKETLDPENCYLMSSELQRDACLKSVAKYSGNQTICDDIEYDAVRDDCNAEFEEETELMGENLESEEEVSVEF